ncbi:zinc transport system permease protein [Sinobacterium caligoides]|uniref:High-affinity zinc uptake system membrane protein ZnuB n=1 Tax=Sinobacterium caligoides TaxID=933926 RepID=A0A3N2DGV9_9GAMM|nr:zinc ABC transporter permease subunit ZnuB [Sinobacterium caligoides]ROR98971.1 zinc transport system permease protein [Sinobacterium caligoides]
MIELLLTATTAALLLTAISGPLGSFVIWKRIAYFGDTLAHSALLGVAFGIWFNINIQLAVVAYCLLSATLLTRLNRSKRIALDTLLGILSHGSLAIGLVLLSLSDNIFIDINGLLFGDLLAVDTTDLYIISAISALVGGLLCYYWRQLLSVTVHPELACVEGINVPRMELLLMLCLALIVAIGMQVVGVLLITALLIIPAATARKFAETPEQMAIYAIGFGAIAVLLGMTLSATADSAAGPSIVTAATLLFLLTQALPNRQ